MLFAILTLALATQPAQPPTPESVNEFRVFMRTKILEAADQVDEFKQKTKERFDLQPSRPRTGLELTTVELSADETGHPVRHTMVSGVFTGSAAEKAGLKPGDRIVAIGDELLDYESSKAVMLYFSNYEAAVPLTVEHKGTSRRVSLVPEPLVCVQAVWQRFPEATWLNVWDRSQKLLRSEAKRLENPALTIKDLEHSYRGYEAMMMLWATSFDSIARALDYPNSPACIVIR